MVSKEHSEITSYKPQAASFKLVSAVAKPRRFHLVGIITLATILITWYALCLPSTLFKVPYSTVLYDKDGSLLNASIAYDGQWRFPGTEKVPDKFASAITLYEDKRFYLHPGIDPTSLMRATWQNIKAGEVISGGSTLTMQVTRLSRMQKSRTIWNKVIEMILATRL